MRNPRRTAPRLALALAATALLLAGSALLASGAQAGCEICDQYTLDIPDPKGDDGGGGSGGGDSSSDPAPAPAPAPAPVAPAPVTTTPSTTTEVAPTAEPEPKPEPTWKKARHIKLTPVTEPEAEKPAEPKTLDSTPLDYDAGDSTSKAALAGLGNPGTLALLAVLIAAGAAVAVGRRRASGS